jgi:CNP1-like family
MPWMSRSSKHAVRQTCVVWLATVCSTLATAQLAVTDPDWKEDSAPTVPAFEIKRYVVVAQSPSGVVNAMYEAIRCGTGEWKTYARYNQDSGWTNASEPKWQPLRGGPSPHAARLASQGVCTGNAAAGSVREIVQNVRQPFAGVKRGNGNPF